jgi:hypothetical protein
MHLLADIGVSSGGGLVHDLLAVFIIGLCVGIVYALGRWFIQKLAAPPIAMTIWNGFFILVLAIVIINFLLGLTGHGFIRY